jgi:hypothetical protein
VADIRVIPPLSGDYTPDQFTFVDQIDVALSSTVTSAPITITGVSPGTVIPFSLDTGLWSKDGVTFVSGPGNVTLNDQIYLRHTASGSGTTQTSQTLTIGGVQATFTTTTQVAPGAFDMTIGLNFYWPQFWANCNPWANLCKGAALQYTGAVNDSWYPTGAIVGSYQMILMQNWVNPGVYYVRWQGTATNVNLGGGTLIADGPPPNELHFNVVGGSGASLDVSVSGGTLTDLQVFHEDDLPRINAGQIVSKLNFDAWAGLAILRPIQCLLADGSRIVNYDDIIPYERVSWVTGARNSYDEAFSGCGPRAACEMANEFGAQLWYNFPPKATDACLTSIWNDINTYLDPALKCYAEMSNEIWNSSWPWIDNIRVFEYWNDPGGLVSIDPNTAIVTDPGHSLITGDEIAMMRRNVTLGAYQGGSLWEVQVIDADSWELRLTGGGAVTTPLPVDEIYYKRHTGSVRDIGTGDDQYRTMREEYAQRALDMWTIGDGIIGRSRNYHVIAGQHTADTFQRSFLDSFNVSGVQAATDGAAIGPYWNIGYMTPPFDTATNAEVQAWSEAEAGSTPGTNGAGCLNLRAFLDARDPTIEMLAYESGDGFGHAGYSNAAKAEAWKRSADGGIWHQWYFQALADLGFDHVNYYCSSGDWAGIATFGLASSPSEFSGGVNASYDQGSVLIRQGGINKTP